MTNRVYFVNGADEGTILVYPSEDIGTQIEEYLYYEGFGQAYPGPTVAPMSVEELLEEDVTLEQLEAMPVISDEVIEKISSLILEKGNGEEVEQLLQPFVQQSPFPEGLDNFDNSDPEFD